MDFSFQPPAAGSPFANAGTPLTNAGTPLSSGQNSGNRLLDFFKQKKGGAKTAPTPSQPLGPGQAPYQTLAPDARAAIIQQMIARARAGNPGGSTTPPAGA